MEEAGLVSRTPDSRDRRAMVVSLTDAGRALRPHIAKTWDVLEGHLDDALGQRKREDLLPLMEDLERSIAGVRRQKS